MKVLITGATSGIGYKVGIKLAELGHFVYMTTHTTGQLLVLKEKLDKLNLPIICFKLDITNKEDRNQTLRLDLDCLINQAGIGIGGSILDNDVDKLRCNFDTNFFGTFDLIKLLLPSLIKKPNSRILVTSSLASVIPLAYLGYYTSSKAALSNLTKALRKELKYVDTELQIGLIEPGIYKTGFNEVMLDNKEPIFSESDYYKNKQKIRNKEIFLFKILGHSNTKSIVKKFIKAVESPYVKKVYRAPLLERILIKIYLLIFG